jgi:DNA-binding transcriptional ArsR family regulator
MRPWASFRSFGRAIGKRSYIQRDCPGDRANAIWPTAKLTAFQKPSWIRGGPVLGTGGGGSRHRLPRLSFLTQLPSVSILHHMVKFQGSQLDRTFAALVDPTRRAILARLEQEESVPIGELARPFAIKLPAVMKHLDVLGNAGLITRSKKGRTVAVRLAPEPMEEAMNWLRRYERFWSASLDRLAAYAEAEEAKARAAKAQENTT